MNLSVYYDLTKKQSQTDIDLENIELQKSTYIKKKAKDTLLNSKHMTMTSSKQQKKE